MGVIGGGSSSIQLVPQLQKLEGVQMTCFVRSKTWISNPFGDSELTLCASKEHTSNQFTDVMMELGLDPKELECKSYSIHFHLSGMEYLAEMLKFHLNNEKSSLPILQNITHFAEPLRWIPT